MYGRSYNQFCALTYALIVAGERWRLLSVRSSNQILSTERWRRMLAVRQGIRVQVDHRIDDTKANDEASCNGAQQLDITVPTMLLYV